MKRYLLCTLLALLALTVQAQSLTITETLKPIEHSSVMAQYQNEFGKHNMPEKDISFPFALIRMQLSGNEQAVLQAKQKLLLDLGTMQKVEDIYRDKPNELLFLVPMEAKNIYITCGDGCERQHLYTGQLQPNLVYICEVRYTPSKPLSKGYGHAKWKFQPETIKDKVWLSVYNGLDTVYNGLINDSLTYSTYDVGIIYSFDVSCKLYETYHGSFELSKANEVHSNEITMKESYNYIQVNADNTLPVRFTLNNDATVYTSSSGKAGPFHPGVYVVHCSQDNYSDQDYTITLNGDLTTKIVNTNLVHETGSIRISSTPTKAQVFIDQSSVGFTPYPTTKLETGKHQIRIKMDGYVPIDTTVIIVRDKETPVHFSLNSQANVQLATSDSVTLYISPHGQHKYTYLKRGSWTGELPVGQYDVKAIALDCDERITTIQVTNEKNVFTIQQPPHQVGYLVVNVNPSNATIYVDGKAYYTNHITLPTGEHKVSATKYGYTNASESTVTIINQTVEQVSFHLLNEWVHGDDLHPDHYFEVAYGLGFQSGFSHYVGASYAYMPKRFGLNISGLYGITSGEVLLTVGPSMRLTDFWSDLNLQLMLGGGAVYDRRSHTFTWAADVGLRFGFEPEDAFAWYSFSIGTKYFNNQFVPSVSLSLIPIRVMCLLADIDESFPPHRAEVMAGYGFTTGNWRYGVNYSYTPSHLGIYGQMLFGGNNNFSVTAGPTFRLTPSDIALDLQLYQGVGWFRDGRDMIGGETGLRLAFDNVETDGFGWWSLNAGFEYAQNGYYGVNFGMSLMPIGAGILLANVGSSLPEVRLEAVLGYGVESHNWKYGFNLSYNSTALGFYTQMLFGGHNNYSITVGPTIRLTPNATLWDLQLYQGIGWYRDEGDMIGGETGMRIGMDIFSLTFGYEYAQRGYRGIHFGFGLAF